MKYKFVTDNNIRLHVYIYRTANHACMRNINEYNILHRDDTKISIGLRHAPKGRGHSQCDTMWQGDVDHCVSRTPFVQRLLSCCTAVPLFWSTYFVNADAGQTMQQLRIRQFQSTHLTICHHRGPTTECATTVYSRKNLTAREMTC